MANARKPEITWLSYDMSQQPSASQKLTNRRVTIRSLWVVTYCYCWIKTFKMKYCEFWWVESDKLINSRVQWVMSSKFHHMTANPLTLLFSIIKTVEEFAGYLFINLAILCCWYWQMTIVCCQPDVIKSLQLSYQIRTLWSKNMPENINYTHTIFIFGWQRSMTLTANYKE